MQKTKCQVSLGQKSGVFYFKIDCLQCNQKWKVSADHRGKVFSEETKTTILGSLREAMDSFDDHEETCLTEARSITDEQRN